MNTVKGGRALD